MLLAELSQPVVVVEGVVVVAEAVASRLELSKFTTYLKLLVNLKSFKIFSKLTEINVFSNSSAASGVVIAAARLELCSSSFQIFLKLLWRYMEVYLQVLKVSSTFR